MSRAPLAALAVRFGIERRLPLGERAMLALLVDRARVLEDEDTGLPTCWPSIERLAEDLAISARSAQRLIAGLRDTGAIEQRRRGPDSCAYAITLSGQKDTPDLAAHSEGKDPPDSANDAPDLAKRLAKSCETASDALYSNCEPAKESTKGVLNPPSPPVPKSLDLFGSNLPAPRLLDPRVVIEAWNSMAEKAELPTVRLMDNAKRLSDLRKLTKRMPLGDILEAIATLGRLPSSAFVRGGNDTGWRATFDWFIRPPDRKGGNAAARLLEGEFSPTRNAWERMQADMDAKAAAEEEGGRQIEGSLAVGAP